MAGQSTITPQAAIEYRNAEVDASNNLGPLAEFCEQRACLVLTNEQLVDAVREQLPSVPTEHIVGEPFKRDTAPCIGVAAALVCAADPDGTMVVMPSDHVIEPRQEFHRAIKAGAALVEKDPKQIVTFGIRPNYLPNPLGMYNAVHRLQPNRAFRRLKSKGFAKNQIAKRLKSIWLQVRSIGIAVSSCGRLEPSSML